MSTAIEQASMRPTVRRILRLGQAVCGVWVTWTIVGLMLADAAAADNCSVFTDCFGVANSAIEAAFGLSLLAVLSLVLDFVPFVGTAKGAVEAVTGRDLLTGQELAPWERALGVLPFAGALGSLGTLARVGNRAADLGDLTRGERVLDTLDDLAAGTRQMTPHAVPPAPRRAVAGDEFPLPSRYTPLVDLYRASDATAAERAYISEALGEAGALDYVQRVAGDDTIRLLRPASAADVTGLIARADTGQAWDSAVAFGGRNATNVVWFDGRDLHIVEAKGGAGQYGDRASVLVAQGKRIDQAHPEYPRDVAGNMRESRITDGRKDIGDLIENMYKNDHVRYVGIRTGPYAEIISPNGAPRIIVEHVFLEPLP